MANRSPLGVDHDRVRQRPLADDERRGSSPGSGATEAPHQASSISSTAAPSVLRDLDGAAEVARVRPTGRRRCRGTSAASPCCASNPPPASITPRSRADGHGRAVARDPDADDAAVSTTRLLERRVQPQRRCCCSIDHDVAGTRRSAPRRCRPAACRVTAPPSARNTQPRAAHEAAGRRPGPAQQPDVVGHDGQRHRRLAGLPPGADRLGVERLDLERPPDLAARALRVVVGVVGRADEASCRTSRRCRRSRRPRRRRPPCAPGRWPGRRRRPSPPGRSRASSRESPTPSRRISGLSGSHMPPPDMAVLPPHLSVHSTMRTDRPSSTAPIAVANPAAPVPTTTTS